MAGWTDISQSLIQSVIKLGFNSIAILCEEGRPSYYILYILFTALYDMLQEILYLQSEIYFTSHIVPPQLLCRFPVAWFPVCVEGELNIACRFLNWECQPSRLQTDYFSLFTGSLLIFQRTEMACSCVFPGRPYPPVMSLSGKHNSLREKARVSK